ncbi:porin PorA family protein [Virgisporangium ochraceum]|uniref:porin PorA family protein n=1 Tax=Virgisporangium ochraceum TaxID=65505 RepID=UPI0019409698|nr:porin PorA family protein [Virgisporangium ochraceum]
MRRSTVLLTGGAVVVLAFAAVLRFAIVPGLQQLPDDLDTTLHYTGTADILDEAALMKGDLANGFKTGVPVELEQRVRVVSAHGDTVVVTDETVLTDPDDNRLSNTKHTFAVDRRNLAAAPAPAGVTVEPHQGLTVGFPIPPEPTDYTYWDYPTAMGATAAYVRTEQRAGRETYVYQMKTAGPLADPSVAGDLPTALSKQVLLAFAPSLPPDQQAQLKQYEALLPDQLPLSYTAEGENTFWVDITTGYVVDVARKQKIDVSLALGPIVVPLASAFSLDLRFAPDTVRTITADAESAASGLRLISVIVPIALVVLAILLALTPLFLARRRRRTVRPQETVTQPVAAPPAASPPPAAAVGADEK